MSTPGLTWDCGLKYTKIRLELLTDYDMMLFIEKGKRGGISGVMGTRHVIANNKYLKDYDKNKESVFLAYWDANNLYGISMSQFLPYSGFVWWTDESINYFNSNLEEATRQIKNVPDESNVGYFLQVDLHYPNSIKELTKNFPLAPNKRSVAAEELSDYQRF